MSHKVGDMERTNIRLIAFFIKHFSHLMVFFIKHFSQCSLKSFTKSSKNLVIQLFGDTRTNSHIYYNILASGSVKDN